ncbi:DUF4041 domain-containing protein [Listeria sp. W9-0585]|uniref:DUF4041 domain-containing protein n=2 Tax=Listeria rustica TaxID=2713503 RepID=A0A7W1YGG9_9LIST|nr:DUF4041 domain-containing protein [Listeria rustica]
MFVLSFTFITVVIGIVLLIVQINKRKELNNKILNSGILDVQALSTKKDWLEEDITQLESSKIVLESNLKQKRLKIADLEASIKKIKEDNVDILSLMKQVQDATQELNDLSDNKEQVEKELKQLKKENTHITTLISQSESIVAEIKTRQSQLAVLNDEIIQTKDEILLQSFGLYEPKYAFEHAETYVERLKDIREQQKSLVKNKIATSHKDTWQVDGSVQKGKVMNNNNIKSALRMFNNECDMAISKVTFKNIDTIEKRIIKSWETINKLNAPVAVEIRKVYLNLKIDELYLCFEYQEKKEEEREEQRALKEQMREEKRVQQEIEQEKKKIEKEERHFANELSRLNKEIPSEPEDKAIWEAKIRELEQKLALVERDKQNVFNREQNTRAGYVYIISNIGSFGENIYKIGVTRRLDPTERVKELGDASVPFKFDIHATIFSEDAPTLENALHKAFHERSVNRINYRKEFFRVTLADIKQEVEKNHNKTVEFTMLAEADEFRQTQKILEQALLLEEKVG